MAANPRLFAQMVNALRQHSQANWELKR
jgi:hypothetical protein